MQKSAKRRTVIGAACCLAASIALLWLYMRPPLSLMAARYPYPPTWDTIDIGDTPQIVARKCPGIDQSLQKIKADFAYFGHPAGTWIFEVHYTPDRARVSGTYLVLRLGSKEHFRSIHYKLKA